MRGMKTIYKVLLVNGSCLVGFAIVGVVNPNASVVVFGLSCLAALVIVNGAVFLVPWLRRRRGTSEKNTAAPPSASEANFWLAVTWLVFILSLVLTWMRRHGYW